MLITTLISLILVIGFAMVVQSVALSGTHTVKRLQQELEADMHHNAIRALARPLLAEAMVNYDTPQQLRLNSTPLELSFAEHSYSLIAQDIQGLVDVDLTPRQHVEALLPPDLATLVLEIRQDGTSNTPLHHRYLAAGGSPELYSMFEDRITDQAKRPQLNGPTLHLNYEEVSASTRGSQPKHVRIQIE